MDAWWRANNYLTVGQIYLLDNPLLREPLSSDHIKPRLLGHWGTSPGLAFVYVHASRLIQLTGQEALYLAGPGHGGPALVAAGYLEGSYTETYPQVTQDSPGMRRLFRQFSAPGGIPSHVSVPTPGSIHEGGELGYVLVHAFGAVMDNPNLLALAVVGDGEAETGPLEGSWKGSRSSTPSGMAQCYPSSTSTAPRSPARRCSPGRTPARSARSSKDTATTSSRWRARTCPACTTASRTPWRAHGPPSAASRTQPGTAPGTVPAPGGRSSCSARPRAGPARTSSTECRWAGPGGHTRCLSPE